MPRRINIVVLILLKMLIKIQQHLAGEVQNTLYYVHVYTSNKHMYINICKIIVDLSKKQLQKEQAHHLYYRVK